MQCSSYPQLPLFVAKFHSLVLICIKVLEIGKKERFIYEKKHLSTKSQRLTDKGERTFIIHEVDNTAANCDTICVGVCERKTKRL